MIDVPLPESIPFDGGRSSRGFALTGPRRGVRTLEGIDGGVAVGDALVANYHPYELISKSCELDGRNLTTYCDEGI